MQTRLSIQPWRIYGLAHVLYLFADVIWSVVGHKTMIMMRACERSELVALHNLIA